MKILWITNIPSPYRVQFFKTLGLKCDLTVLFEKSSSSERNDSWTNYVFENFTGILLRGFEVSADRAFSPSVIKYLRRNKYDHIIVSNIASPTGILAIEYMRMCGIPYLIEGDGGIPKDGVGIKEKLKKHIIKGAKGYFSTGAKHDSYYLKYGANNKNIFRYPFTSLYSKDILQKPLSDEEKKKYKTELGIKEDIAIVTIGQFIHRKGYDILLNACGLLHGKAGVYLIGGKPNDEYLKIIKDNKLSNIHFCDFMEKSDILKWLKAADIFVLPTREDIWGLVINEAMSAGLPIITTTNCVAGTELIKDGINGFIISTEDSLSLAEKISKLENDKNLRKEMAYNNLDKIKEYTFEKMADRHIFVFMELNNK